MRFKTQVKTLSCKRKDKTKKKYMPEEYRLLGVIGGGQGWNKEGG